MSRDPLQASRASRHEWGIYRLTADNGEWLLMSVQHGIYTLLATGSYSDGAVTLTTGLLLADTLDTVRDVLSAEGACAE